MEVSPLLGQFNCTRAVQAAGAHNGGGLNDWRLPSKDELNRIYENLQRRQVINLGNEHYWSVTEFDTGNAWVLRFSDGNQNALY